MKLNEFATEWDPWNRADDLNCCTPIVRKFSTKDKDKVKGWSCGAEQKEAGAYRESQPQRLNRDPGERNGTGGTEIQLKDMRKRNGFRSEGFLSFVPGTGLEPARGNPH